MADFFFFNMSRGATGALPSPALLSSGEWSTPRALGLQGSLTASSTQSRPNSTPANLLSASLSASRRVVRSGLEASGTIGSGGANRLLVLDGSPPGGSGQAPRPPSSTSVSRQPTTTVASARCSSDQQSSKPLTSTASGGARLDTSTAATRYRDDDDAVVMDESLSAASSGGGGDATSPTASSSDSSSGSSSPAKNHRRRLSEKRRGGHASPTSTRTHDAPFSPVSTKQRPAVNPPKNLAVAPLSSVTMEAAVASKQPPGGGAALPDVVSPLRLKEFCLASPHSGGETVLARRPATSSALRQSCSVRINLGRRDLIGKGSFGSVFRAIDQDTNRIIAVKEIMVLPGPQREEQLEKLNREISVMERLERHPHIVQLLGHHFDGNNTFRLFMEFMTAGALTSLVKCFGPMLESQAQRVTRQVVEGLAFLHSRRIAHRDLKGDNILLDTNGNVKLADFGTAKEIATNNHGNTVAGTACFMAPEVIRGTGHGLEADIWSLGCCVLEMLTGRPPFSQLVNSPAAAAPMMGPARGSPDAGEVRPNSAEMRPAPSNPYAIMMRIAEMADRGGDVPLPAGLSDRCTSFLRRCLQTDAMLRPTAEELLRDPWIRDVAASDAATASGIKEGGLIYPPSAPSQEQHHFGPPSTRAAPRRSAATRHAEAASPTSQVSTAVPVGRGS